MKVFKFLTKRIREGRDAVQRVKYTIFFLFSGHGFMKEGMQNFLLNEYDERLKSYKTISIEPQLRLLAGMPNAYGPRYRAGRGKRRIRDTLLGGG